MGTGQKVTLCEMKQITKCFDKVTAIKDIDFEIYAGEVHALMGENGAGKSTLMKILYGYYSRTSGDVKVSGKEVHFNSTHDAEAAGIGMVPQEIDLFPELTVTENLFVGRKRPRKRWGGFDTGKMQEEAREVFEKLDVNLDVASQVKHLSVANCQMIEIARALIRQAKVIIFDEPTASLTDRETERLFKVIQELKEAGVGVVYISHRLEEIFRICDRITVLRDGRWVASDVISEFSQDKLVKLMVGRPLSQLFTRGKSRIGKTVLSVEGLSSDGRFADVSFEIREGEVVGMAGLIGAGRSEIGQALFGVLPVTSGNVKIHGEEVHIKSPEDAMRKKIVYLPEERRSQGLILPMSIGSNISLASLGSLTKYGFINYKKEKEISDRYIHTLSIRGASVDKPVSQLSGGNQQKVVVSKIMVREPEILILDEPTRGIDIGAKSEIYKLIDELAGQGKAILLISSELPEVLSMSDRILVMHEGKLTGEFDKEEATQEKIGLAASGVADGRQIDSD
ncbi:ribose import ATP-binding protein RbsA [Lachnospiraceae bacterium]|uniref:sugar ABC transporter ATP-binding protein n=1 Tax=Extibacter sp. GGCC_0201 TaxID=2731209 RepID=UPI001FB67FD1|nr:sugar ABC transporter ATP-binding protein [Extibacter sp. GGCC_0201]BDF34504.1 ribose import ATP-binding protein RbsA [Lachnospiraceae bacterium]BDF38506.1 ribose import ATP-binding protein RbsA [Lachnospiraceae bacterium]